MTIKIKISPESILSDVVSVENNGNVFGVYSGISNIISGSTYGTSSLTGLTVPILLTETIRDFGYYSLLDGDIVQQNTMCNFIVSSTTENPYFYIFRNTSDDNIKELTQSKYILDWGDGSPFEVFTDTLITHTYPKADKMYNITLTQENTWGINVVSKKVDVPYKSAAIENLNGNNVFIPKLGSWENTPDNQDYIYDFDYNIGDNVYDDEILVSAITKSRLSELSNYGVNKYLIGVPIIKYGDIFGVVDDVSDNYTGYTIQGVKYFDFDGYTVSVHKTSGLTDVLNQVIIKDEFLIGMVEQPQIQTNLFVERGKISPYENIMRIGEINNINDLENYGYGFFKIVNKT